MKSSAFSIQADADVSDRQSLDERGCDMRKCSYFTLFVMVALQCQPSLARPRYAFPPNPADVRYAESKYQPQISRATDLVTSLIGACGNKLTFVDYPRVIEVTSGSPVLYKIGKEIRVRRSTPAERVNSNVIELIDIYYSISLINNGSSNIYRIGEDGGESIKWSQWYDVSFTAFPGNENIFSNDIFSVSLDVLNDGIVASESNLGVDPNRFAQGDPWLKYAMRVGSVLSKETLISKFGFEDIYFASAPLSCEPLSFPISSNISFMKPGGYKATKKP